LTNKVALTSGIDFWEENKDESSCSKMKGKNIRKD
jgi:hypothetical protein